MASPHVLSGTVHTPARHMLRAADGQWLLQFDMELPSDTAATAVRVRVVMPFGQGHAAAIAASSRANALRRGARVTVHARTSRRMRGGLRLGGIEQIETPDTPSRHFQEQDA